ncbi:MAG: DUF1015 domain-containing protein [Eubacterium sp.]|nr:DUF1015 domain-containing protein [Eubacterium sp.]
MADVRPFAAMRPAKDLVSQVAALPYDVYNRQEAKVEALREPKSFLRIDRPETNFSDDFDMYSQESYDKARELLDQAFNDGTYVEEESKMFYIYELIMDGRHQTGIVALSSIDDYISGVIKKHENTREEKELDRINHIYNCSAQTGPIFLAYREKKVINDIVNRIKKEYEPLYSFTSPDGITHNVWQVNGTEDLISLLAEFKSLENVYIADGHHRAASAVKVGLRKREENEGYTGEEEFNYFLSVLFPDSELKILPYNRVVKDLNGHTEADFLERLKEVCEVIKDDVPVEPENKGTFGMFLNDTWYRLKFKEEILNDDPVKGLDVSLLQDYVLEPLLGIKDPRIDSRIDFVGGIRGLSELERRVHSDSVVAFSMYPTSIAELFSVADAGLLMPPKSTWFEPKLRSGIFIHRI